MNVEKGGPSWVNLGSAENVTQITFCRRLWVASLRADRPVGNTK